MLHKATVTSILGVLLSTGLKRQKMIEERVGVPIPDSGVSRLHVTLKEPRIAQSLGPVKNFILIVADGPFYLETGVLDNNNVMQVQRTLHTRLFLTYGKYDSVSLIKAPVSLPADPEFTTATVLLS